MLGDWIESGRFGRLLPWLLIAVTFAVYLPSLSGGFLNYDDPWLIEHNSLLADPSLDALRRIWLDLSTSTRLILGAEYLPLRDTTLWLEARLYGLNPLPLRLLNLGIYLGAILWLRQALLRTPLSRTAVEIAIWLFALHPVHVESVAWLAGRKDVLALFFSAAALASYAGETHHKWWRVPLFVTAAMLSKSASVVLPLLLLAHDLLLRRRPDFRALLGSSGCVLATMVVHLWVGAGVHMVDSPLGGSRAHALFTMGPVWLRYSWGFISPASLSIAHDVPVRHAFDALSLAGYGALLTWGAAGLWLLLRQKPLTLFAWLWFVVPLLPMSQVLVPLQNAMADRYTLLSVLSFCLIVGVTLSSAPRLRGVLALTLLAFYGAATWQRSALFADSAALFADGASKAKASAVAHYQLGHALEMRGDLGDAAGAYEAALACQPTNGEVQRRATNNLARVYVKLNRLADAEVLLERGRSLWPDDAKMLRNLIKVVTRRGDETRARALFLELQRSFTDNSEPDFER